MKALIYNVFWKYATKKIIFHIHSMHCIMTAGRQNSYSLIFLLFFNSILIVQIEIQSWFLHCKLGFISIKFRYSIDSILFYLYIISQYYQPYCIGMAIECHVIVPQFQFALLSKVKILEGNNSILYWCTGLNWRRCAGVGQCGNQRAISGSQKTRPRRRVNLDFGSLDYGRVKSVETNNWIG